ncbi:protein unc-93 homolog A-like, partial [Nannospalax galili]
MPSHSAPGRVPKTSQSPQQPCCCLHDAEGRPWLSSAFLWYPHSSLYSQNGLGVATLSTLYSAVLLSSMFLPPILIKKCGCKWTIAGSMCCYVAFSLGSFHASWYTLIPTSILLGLGAAPLWSAHCTYLTIMGNSEAQKSGKLSKDVVNQYFGIFFLIFQSSGVWGNLISSLVFAQTPTQ